MVTVTAKVITGSPLNTTSSEVSVFLDRTTMTPLRPGAPIPRLSQGVYRTLAEDNSIEYTYFKSKVLPPIQSSYLKTNYEFLYPVIMVSNVSKVKRKVAVCLRSYWDFAEFSDRLMATLPDIRARSNNKVKYLANMLPFITKTRRQQAIQEFVNSIVDDSRIFNLSLFHLFLYSDIETKEIFADNAGIRYLRGEFQIAGNLSQQEISILRNLKEPLNQIMDLSECPMPTNAIPGEMFHGNEPDPDRPVEAIEYQFPINEDKTDASNKNTSKKASETKIKKPEPIEDSMKNASQISTEHEMHVARSFLNLGNVEEVQRRADGTIHVYDPDPSVEVGSCPKHCQRRHERSPKLKQSRTLAVMSKRSDLNGVVSCPIQLAKPLSVTSSNAPVFKIGSVMSSGDEIDNTPNNNRNSKLDIEE